MELDKQLLKDIVNESVKTRKNISTKFNITEIDARKYIFIAENLDSISNLFETDAELVESNVKYKKQQQKFQDLNRINNKTFRESARVENAVSEYVQQLCSIFDNNPYCPVGISHISNNKTVGIIQLSDLHFNELIDIKTNKYDFDVASKRIYKLVSEAILYFNVHQITDVFVMFSGDTLNSDRRLDELVSMATNRSKATFISVQILENALMHLNQHFNVYVAGVCGNESRVGKDYNWSNELVSDNYDFTIFNILRYKLQDTKGINFLGMSDKHEEVIEVNGKNFLILHGHQISKDVTKDVSKLVRKYSQMGIEVNFTMWGHIHEAMIADTYARSSSLCGSNNYSEDGLLLVSRASQNIYMVFDKDRIDTIKIDLQNTEGYEGYDTKNWKDAYNPKSVEKLHKSEIILKITI